MIVPDVNLLVYAYDRDTPFHLESRRWWEDLLGHGTPVGLAWSVVWGYVRVMTNRRIRVTPLSTDAAIADVRRWLEVPAVSIIEPGPAHLALVERLLHETAGTGNLVTDAQLAALALERQAELHSNDTDFARFAGLRWRNPLVAAR